MFKLQTTRLWIRYFKGSDSQDLFDYLSDPNVVKYEPYGVLTMEESITEAAKRCSDKRFLAVCHCESGKVIGNLYFDQTQPFKTSTYEIGYVFNTNYQGQGYATEALSALIHHIFTSLEAHRIIAMCNTENKPSWRLLERQLFRREATCIENMFFEVDQHERPLWFDSYQYALLRSEWEAGISGR